jgi:hypothetical protein
VQLGVLEISMAQKPPANVVNSKQDDEEIDGVQEGAKPYHLMLIDFSRGPSPSEVSSLWLETSYSTASLITSRSLRGEMDRELFVPPNTPPILSSW